MLLFLNPELTEVLDVPLMINTFRNLFFHSSKRSRSSIVAVKGAGKLLVLIKMHCSLKNKSLFTSS